MNLQKKKKSLVISTRLTEDEYADVLLRIANSQGESLIKPSDYFRHALLDANVVVNDKEVEQYRVFILSKISNNLNQIAKRLNQDHGMNLINEATYQDILNELVQLNQSITVLSHPVR